MDVCYTYSGQWKKILPKDEQKELLHQFGTILYPLTDVSYEFIALSRGSQYYIIRSGFDRKILVIVIYDYF